MAADLGVSSGEAYNDAEAPGNISEASEKAVLDLSFGTEASVKGFKSEEGGVSWKDGRLVYTVNGSAPALISPEIQVEPGHPYSMLLPLRNTILIRAKNNTDASLWRVSVRTEGMNEFSDRNSKTVEVTPSSGGFETYYVNLSELGLSGYLRGFKIEPLGASSGTVEIKEISFEREDPIIETAGEIISCTADIEKSTITVKGRLKEEYSGRKVILYETNITNYSESISGTVAGSAEAKGTDFTIIIPLTVSIGTDKNMTRLSSLFIAAVEGVKVTAKPFAVENYRDFDENPYEFSLPDYTAVVTDAEYGALGDGYTDDTDAIQKAVDAVSKNGGGRVVLPGDIGNFYGKRYIATNIKLKSNVEFVIEKGAVLWQSPRNADYKYDAFYGHDIPVPGINWTHSFLCHNLPLLQGDSLNRIKVTGGGTIRCMDCGGEDPTGYDGVKMWIGCPNKIHIEPLGLYACTDVEISDITFLRSNGYHISLQGCENVYAANLKFREVACASGDGISLFVGTKNVFITRLMDLSNDDAVVLVSAYNDPRGLTWWKSHPEKDNSIANITVCHSFIQAGHGVTFITWGTDNPDLSKNVIRDINVYDNVLCQVGTWCDNPYYGESPFTNLETDDYSPVQGVRIFGNKTAIEYLMTIQATDMVTDSKLRSTSQFRFGDFERHDKLHPEWISGLANWTVREKGGKAEALPNDSGYMGVVNGKAMLAQGLYMSEGGHRFTADIRVVSGSALLFAADIQTGEILSSAEYTADRFNGGWKRVSLTFNGTESNVYLGIEVLSDDGAADIDNCTVEDIDSYTVMPDKADEIDIESLTAGVDPHTEVL